MDSWCLGSDEIASNIKSIRSRLKKGEAFYIPGSDSFLSEYIPLQDCFCYYLSGFTGSTAEMLITYDEVFIYLDGRYHEQGEKECHALVTTINVSFGTSLKESLLSTINRKNISLVYYVAQRTPLNLYKALSDLVKMASFSEQEFKDSIKHNFSPELNSPYLLDRTIVGLTSKEKLAKLFLKDCGSAYFICSLDQVSWITNTRGFHAPYQSFFNAKAFVTAQKIYLFSDQSYEWSSECEQSGLIEMLNFSKLDITLAEVIKKQKISKIYFSNQEMTVENYQSLKQLSSNNLKLEHGSILKMQMVKNSCELKEMQANFMSSNYAIVKSLLWLKESVVNNSVSELDFYKRVDYFYKKEGAVSQSFQTIAAVDENSSIIHFSDSQADKYFAKESIVLLDSGGHYSSGYATDTSRTICVGNHPHPDFIKQYSLVLKGLLKAEMAIFPEGTIGAQIDALAREALRSEGMDYAHGTGHGVGINVHEGGFSISSKSVVPLIESTVGSIEPGYYLSGVGGVRLENISVIKKHPTFSDMLYFQPLTFIGYDFNLIDLSLLSKVEIKYLATYEQQCEQLGTSFNWQQSELYLQQSL